MVTWPLVIFSFPTEKLPAPDEGEDFLPPPRLEKFHWPEAECTSVSSGWSTVMLVTSTEREKISGSSLTPTASDLALRKGPLLNAGSSPMVMSLAVTPPASKDRL